MPEIVQHFPFPFTECYCDIYTVITVLYTVLAPGGCITSCKEKIEEIDWKVLLAGTKCGTQKDGGRDGQGTNSLYASERKLIAGLANTDDVDVWRVLPE